jgi:hypothetical protein
MFSQQLQNYVNEKWRGRILQPQTLEQHFEQVLTQCQQEESLLLRFLLVSLPMSDLGDYPVEDLLAQVRHALFLRRETKFAKELPEHLFLLYVLCPRINNEELRPYGAFFFEKVWDLVKDLSLEEAILACNRWCAQQATYRASDDRTASALAVYERGCGRCGEESVFLTAVLRSVGIAARQIYAPWWSHCDDNHAWVEAYDGAQWRYLGACEPEPVLDHGWFVHASSRAVLEHAKIFIRGGKKETAFLFPDTSPDLLCYREGLVFENVTDHYGKTVPFQVTVKAGNGTAVAGAVVNIQVVNMARLCSVTKIVTDAHGKASIALGEGSIYVSAVKENLSAGILVDLRKAKEAEVVLKPLARNRDWWEFPFVPPEDGPVKQQVLTPAQKQQRGEVLDACKAMRESRKLPCFQPDNPRLLKIWELLTEKDKAAYVMPEVLEESLPLLEDCGNCPPELLDEWLLSPRIHLEPLRPWRRICRQMFTPEEQKEFRSDPERMWQWIRGNIREELTGFKDLPETPAGMVRRRAASPFGRRVLFVACCRALGIPAKLSPVNGEPEFFLRSIKRISENKEKATLVLSAPEDQSALYHENWTICKKRRGFYAPLELMDIPQGEKREITLCPGEYRIVTSVRKPDGSQMVHIRRFTMLAGEKRGERLRFSKLCVADLFQQYPLPAAQLRAEENIQSFAAEEKPLREIVAGKAGVILWLEPGREPTEHILNELRESKDAFSGAGLDLWMILEKPCKDHTLDLAREALPFGKVYLGDYATDAPMAARQLFLDPDRMPYVLLVNEKGTVRYACCGYNVGTAELLIRLAGEPDFSSI